MVAVWHTAGAKTFRGRRRARPLGQLLRSAAPRRRSTSPVVLRRKRGRGDPLRHRCAKLKAQTRSEGHGEASQHLNFGETPREGGEPRSTVERRREEVEPPFHVMLSCPTIGEMLKGSRGRKRPSQFWATVAGGPRSEPPVLAVKPVFDLLC